MGSGYLQGAARCNPSAPGRKRRKRRLLFTAAEIASFPHARWREYLTGRADYEVLLQARGIGPRRAELIMASCGSAFHFLSCTVEELQRLTRGKLSAAFAAKLQQAVRTVPLTEVWALLASDLEGDPKRGRRKREAPPLAPRARRSWRRLPETLTRVASLLRTWMSPPVPSPARTA